MVWQGTEEGSAGAHIIPWLVRPCSEEIRVWQGAEEGNTVDTLARMLGVHLSIHGEVLPENVRKWNVRRFELPRDNRHRDRPVVRDIYAALDTFLAAKQSPLAY